MTTNQLSGLTNTELVGVYNGLVGPEFSLKAWKGKKDVLIARIEAARQTVAAKGNGKLTSPIGRLVSPDLKPEATEDAPSDRATAKATGKQGARTIRLAAIELLCEVDYFEDRDKKSGPDNVVGHQKKSARSVGVPYNEILRRIRVEFPDCGTTVACLRWYSVKIRVEEPGYEGLRLPQRRPRAKPKAA